MDFFYTGQDKHIQNTLSTNNGVVSTINQLSMNIDNVVNSQNKLSQYMNKDNRVNYNDILMQKSFVNECNYDNQMKMINQIYQQEQNIFNKDNVKINYLKENNGMNIYGGNNYVNVGIHPVLEQFNEQLKIEEENKQPNSSDNNKNVEKDTNDVFKNDMEVIINTIEAQDDSRMKNSKFLSFIKDLNNGTTSFDSTNNTIVSSQPPNNNNDNNVDTTIQQNKNDPYQQMNDVWNSISSQVDSLPPHLLSLSPSQYFPEAQKYLDAHDYSTGISLLNSYLQYTTSNNSPSLESIHTLSKTYMDIGRSDLALSTLTQNTSLISNHIPSLLLLSMCYANGGEDYKAISTLLSILSLPKYNKLSSIESNLYLNKSFIEQYLNPDNIDITNTLSY